LTATVVSVEKAERIRKSLSFFFFSVLRNFRLFSGFRKMRQKNGDKTKTFIPDLMAEEYFRIAGETKHPSASLLEKSCHFH
jgi:hypothetical protein